MGTMECLQLSSLLIFLVTTSSLVDAQGKSVGSVAIHDSCNPLEALLAVVILLLDRYYCMIDCIIIQLVPVNNTCMIILYCNTIIVKEHLAKYHTE